ncbi:MAG TPA: DUF2339 domain-containing protein [Terriglobales bacterium]|nr:DUF2339 domain-containing protein [Terriglobales bacterium]
MADNESSKPDLEELTRLVRDLVVRVSRIEQQLGSALSAVSRPHTSVPPGTPQTSSKISSPDLESRIGSQWLNRIGIVAVLIGVSFFLKYAFENDLIGPGGRVVLGLVGGLAVIVSSEWFRRESYRVFSISLKALGLGMLYLSLWAAFQLYQLIPWSLAFIAMVAITASTTFLALSQDAEVLALFALIGGFLTPILLYTGQNQELDFFLYMGILDLATVVLAGLRGWQRLVLVSLIFTTILYFVWYMAFYSAAQLPTTLAFATAFFILFAAAPLVQLTMHPADNRWLGVLFTSAANAAVFLLELYALLERTFLNQMAWCAVGLGMAYFALGFYLPARSATGEALGKLYSVLGTACITLAIAIGFLEQWISLGWFLQAAILMTFGFWRKSRFVRWQALALLAATITKVFVVDIWQLQRGYRIMSFMALGVLLLVISFMYQRDWLRQFTSKV